MTRVKYIKTENHQLKAQVNDLKKELEFYTKKDHETFKLSQRLSITRWDDGQYMVAGPISKTLFRLNCKEELDYMIDWASVQTRELYIKNAMDWLIEESSPSMCGDIKFYEGDNLPMDTIIIHPKLKYTLMSMLVGGVLNWKSGEARLKRVGGDVNHV